MQATFVILEPRVTPSEYTLELPVTIGRGREADLKFANGLISRRHCELVEYDGSIMVRDLGSRNGTFVSGNRVESAPLAPGELLTVGGITLRAVYGTPEDVALAPDRSAEAALSETLPMDDTMTVQAKSFADVADEEWPEEESSLEFEEEEEEMGADAIGAESEVQELKADEMEWLDEPEPQPQRTPDKSKPKKPSAADDDFDSFLEGLR
jgi:pSer/pThr/pTyr-binding forkhead associated (FHA) protein